MAMQAAQGAVGAAATGKSKAIVAAVEAAKGYYYPHQLVVVVVVPELA